MPLPSLRSLLWLTAIVLLAVNDHILKGYPGFPGALTGKLSDFAGLIVAPVFIARTIRATLPSFYEARRDSIAVGSMVSVAFGFAAINLDPSTSKALEHLLGVIGMSWKLWPDPTDLVALAVLPLTYFILNEPSPDGKDRWAVVPLATSAILCLASGVPPKAYSMAFLINRSGGTVSVRTATLDGEMNCEGPFLDDGILTLTDFIPGGISLLASREVVTLAGHDEDGRPDCRPLRLAIWDDSNEDDPIVVTIDFDRKSREISIPPTAKDLEDTTRLAVIRRNYAGLYLELGDGLRDLELADGEQQPVDVACDVPVYTTIGSTASSLTIDRVEPVSERCTAYRGTTAESAGSDGLGGASGLGGATGIGGAGGAEGTAAEATLTVCTDQEFDLDIGDEAAIRSRTVRPSYTSDEVMLSSSVAWRRDVRQVSQSIEFSVGESTSCPQRRHECGAVFRRMPPDYGSFVASSGYEFEAAWTTIVAREDCPIDFRAPLDQTRGVSIR